MPRRRRNAWMALNEDEESLVGFWKCKLILTLPLSVESRYGLFKSRLALTEGFKFTQPQAHLPAKLCTPR